MLLTGLLVGLAVIAFSCRAEIGGLLDQDSPAGQSAEGAPEPRQSTEWHTAESSPAASREVNESPDRRRVPEGSSPAAAAYLLVAGEIPGLGSENVRGTYRSVLDPSWAAVLITVPELDGYYAIFAKRNDGKWKARHSVVVDRSSPLDGVEAALGDVPRDLVEIPKPQEEPLSPATSPESRAVALIERHTDSDRWKATEVSTLEQHARVRLEREGDPERYTHAYLLRQGETWLVKAMGRDLTSAGAPGFPEELVEPGELPDADTALPPSPAPVMEDVPENRRGEVEEAVERAEEIISRYRDERGGVAGFYVQDLEGDFGYGMRPDELFFSASTIKLPVMVAVFRKIDAGELSYDGVHEVKEEDWASGSGTLRWQPPGTPYTIKRYLRMMMTKSDNVATNALIRLVGGPEYVNEVARSLGAESTALRQKVTNQRGAVPLLDNRTTTRDMAAMMQSIRDKEAASPENCQKMMDLMRRNEFEDWIETPLPPEVETINKGGWLYGSYNDAVIVQAERPYVVTIFTKYTPVKKSLAVPPLKEISKAVWEAQGKTRGEDKDRTREGKTEPRRTQQGS